MVLANGERVAIVITDVHLASGAQHKVVAIASSTEARVWRGESAAADALVELQLHRPRWVVWSNDTVRALTTMLGEATTLLTHNVTAADRLLRGRWRVDTASIWCALRGLDPTSQPASGQLDLLASATDVHDVDQPVRPDGYLAPEWIDGDWATTDLRATTWARLLYDVSIELDNRLAAHHPAAAATVRIESAAELLCVELERDGLPFDVSRAEQLITSLVGPRPATVAEEAEQRAERDRVVLDLVPHAHALDLRSPNDVKSLLRRAGIDVPDTRAWRLERLVDQHPVVQTLLTWRKAERVATTFGYNWIDRHVRDGRLRGEWSASDGAAGRMTAQAGLHNMPADMRVAVVADGGWTFVRADLGQIEPRVLAAISDDQGLTTATRQDDMYLSVATELSVDRPTAKIAVLAAMYGQTSGTAGHALRAMERAYPVALNFLRAAADSGAASRDITTAGGRRVRMSWPGDAAARGRYARNAIVQGSAAELFKLWAVTSRARLRDLGASIVLCLHDELLIHVPFEQRSVAAQRLVDALDEASHRWNVQHHVRFVADVSIADSWAGGHG